MNFFFYLICSFILTSALPATTRADTPTLYLHLDHRPSRESVHLSFSSPTAYHLDKIIKEALEHSGIFTVVPDSTSDHAWGLHLLHHPELGLQLTIISAEGKRTTEPWIPVKEGQASLPQALSKMLDLFLRKTVQAGPLFELPILGVEQRQKRYRLQESYLLSGRERVLYTSPHLLSTPYYLPSTENTTPKIIFFVGYETGQAKIYQLERGGRPYLWSSLKGNQFMPCCDLMMHGACWVSDATGNPDIFYQKMDGEKKLEGKPQHLFTAKFATQASPSLSPDGTEVVFVSDKEGQPRVYRMPLPLPYTRLNTLKPTRVHPTLRECSAPAWSPDGKKIAYCGKDSEGVRQIWVTDLEKNSHSTLTEGPHHKENPQWSPKSDFLIYNILMNDGPRVALVSLTYQYPVMLPLRMSFPHWPAYASQEIKNAG